MPRRSKYASTESASCLLVNELAKKVKDHLRKTGRAGVLAPDALTEEVRSCLESIDVDGCRYQFSPCRNHLGGVRWFVLCPKCGAQCLKLFKPDASLGKGEEFLCARCHGLKSPSALYGPTAKYRDIVKPLKRMTKIRERLRSGRKLTDEETHRLMKEHEDLKEAMLASPEYQRLRFKLESEGMIPPL